MYRQNGSNKQFYENDRSNARHDKNGPFPAKTGHIVSLDSSVKKSKIGFIARIRSKIYTNVYGIYLYMYVLMFSNMIVVPYLILELFHFKMGFVKNIF